MDGAITIPRPAAIPIKPYVSSRKHESKKHILPLSRGAGYTRRTLCGMTKTMKRNRRF